MPASVYLRQALPYLMIEVGGNEVLPSQKDNLRWIRPAVQLAFVLASILLGLQFRTFVMSLADEASPVAYRPPWVEAYLPISSLMSLVYLVKTGVPNQVHPAGLVIFTLVVVLTLALRRGFCSWVCPFGTFSEYLHKFGRKIIGRNLLMPMWLDLPLRGVKYLLLGFFLYVILRMPVIALGHFINGPYNRMADVKMYLFFAHISPTALQVIVVLVILSILFKNFWCRYLCPYGALLCIVSLVSPTRVSRNSELCTNCGACTRACPNRIPVQKKSAVCSGECTACLSCVDACPTQGALVMSIGRSKVTPKLTYAIVLVAAFYFAGEVASALGYWHSETPLEMYRALYKIVPQLGHPRGL